MKARRVITRTLLGHTVQVGFQIRAVGVTGWPWNKPWHWKVATFVDDHAPVTQCWSQLVDWALGPDTGGMGPLEAAASLLPWRPLPRSCRDRARDCGACYCGRVIRADVAAEQGAQPDWRVVVPTPTTAEASA